MIWAHLLNGTFSLAARNLFAEIHLRSFAMGALQLYFDFVRLAQKI